MADAVRSAWIDFLDRVSNHMASPLYGPNARHVTWWRWQREGSTGWNVGARAGRVAFRWTLIRHQYGPDISDRWVWQTSHHYDRKRKQPSRIAPLDGAGA